MSDSVEPEERSQALGWLTAASSAGVMIGPGIASLTTILGPSAPGFFAAGLCVLNSISAWFFLPESAQHVKEGVKLEKRPSVRHAVMEVVQNPRTSVATLIWIYAIGMMAFMAMNGILVLFLERVHGVTAQTVGLFYMYVGGISLLMRGVLLGPTIRWLGEVRTMRVGIVSLLAGFVLIPLTQTVPQLAIAILLIPVGMALVFPANTSLVSRLAPKRETGQTLGVQQAFGGLSRLIGPLWAGAVFQYIDLRAPFWLCASLAALAGLLAATLSLDSESEGVAPESIEAEAS